MKTVIKNIQVVTMDSHSSIFKNGAIVIDDDKIVFAGNESDLTDELTADAKVIDGKGMTALPGFINAHTHSAMSVFRGFGNDLPLMDWLHRIWPLEDQLKPEEVYWLSLLSIAEMIASGTTTFCDMYMFMDHTMQAVIDSGVKAVLSRGLQGYDDFTPKRIDETLYLIKHHGSAKGRIRAMVAPHAIYTCSPEFIKEWRDMAAENNVGIHIHLSETIKEVEDSLEKYKKTPPALLEEIGLLDVPVAAAHCVHLTDEDVSILSRYNVSVLHCPISNMKLASGFADTDRMLKNGICVALGTDGAASNNNLSIFKEMNMAALMIKGYKMDATAVNANTALQMATINGARALLIDNETGSLEAGKKADIILIDMDKPHYYPGSDIITDLVYSGHSSDVDTVFVNGEVLYKNREYTTHK